MNIMLLPKMVLSPAAAWSEIKKTRPSRAKIIFLLVVPFALLPPAMLYYAGIHHGDAFAQGFGDKPWALITPLFFLLEILTFFVMTRLVKNIADTYSFRISAYDALLLTAVSAIPLFLSSLALAVPSIGFCVAALFVAMCYACAIFYHGTYALSHLREELFAAHFTYTAIGVAAAWVSLMLFFVLMI